MAKDLYVKARLDGGIITAPAVLSGPLRAQARLGQTVKEYVHDPEYEGAYTVTPSETAQTLETEGLSMADDVTVEGIPDSYVGSGVPVRGPSDMYTDDEWVYAPAGYYPNLAARSVNVEQSCPKPTITVDEDGLITATETISAGGYYGAGLTNSRTRQLSKQAGKTVTPTDEEQTAVAAGKFTTGDVLVGPIPSTYMPKSAWSWMGVGPEKLDLDYSLTLALKDTNFPSWTPSNTAGSIRATANVKTFTADMANYEYFLHWTYRIDAVTTDGATLKAQIIRECQDAWQHLLRRPNTVTVESGDFVGNGCVTVMTAPLLVYYNTSGNRGYVYSNINGIYPTVQAATFSNSTSDTPTVTVKTPVIYAKCHDSYMTTARAEEFDTTNTKLYLTCEVFRVPIGGIARVAYQNVIDTYGKTV